MITKIIVIFVLGALLIYWVQQKYTIKWEKPPKAFPSRWRALLRRYVAYYRMLKQDEKQLFEYKVNEFLTNVKIMGAKTKVEELDKILIAASAVIPIFAFPEWKYKNLSEVILYSGNFDLAFETEGRNKRIQGMVGTGFMDRKMILSKTALRRGFENKTDKHNTAIHEFVHLIDKSDGQVDGIPTVLLERPYVIPWMDMIERKLEEIVANDSDINPYATTGREEFFAVLSEYFFECPLLLKKKHPKLYEMLEEIFDQDLAGRERTYRLKK